MLSILSPLQQILTPSVVGEVIKDPDAIGHCTGVHLAQLVGVVHRGAVIGALYHLPTKVRPLVQPHLPCVSINLETKAAFQSMYKQSKNPQLLTEMNCLHKTNWYFNPLNYDIVVSTLASSLTFFTVRQDLTLSLKAIHCWLSAYSPGLRMYWKPL